MNKIISIYTTTLSRKPYLLIRLLFVCFFNFLDVNAQAIKVEIQKTTNGNGYQLLRDQKPYYIVGAGGQTQLDLVIKLGGNSIRTWGLENAQEILDEAQKKGLTVMLGFWIQHERHGFDYDNEIKVRKANRIL